tara:strand:+ start:136 stop:339 length:204 start_codon:yes stop_codon:yes gene_type:complete
VSLRDETSNTSKGTIQGYNGIAGVDSKHQIIVHAQAYGEGPEQHALVPMLLGIKRQLVSAAKSTLLT